MTQADKDMLLDLWAAAVRYAETTKRANEELDKLMDGKTYSKMERGSPADIASEECSQAQKTLHDLCMSLIR